MPAEPTDQAAAEAYAQIAAVNEGRAATYRTLAFCYFKELSQEQIELIAREPFVGVLDDEPLIAEGFADIRRYLHRIDSGTRQELAADYAHTFLAAGNYESFAATPYESVFTSPTGLLMQEARDEVYKMYCAEHVQPDERLRTPEDHVSFEFEFMAHMIERTNAALTDGDLDEALRCARTALDFHTAHLAVWIDDLCDAVDEVARTRFYRGLGKVTRGFVHLEGDVARDEVEMLEELAAPVA